MKESRFFYAPNAIEHDELPDTEAAHALRVLRLKEGDEIFLIDGKGAFHRALVSMTSSKHCFYNIQETLPQNPLWRGNIHLALAPTKNMDRMEWLAEKATEIGINELSFLNSQFSERKVVKNERIEKIVVSAVKQSRKAWMPVIHEMTNFDSFVRSPHKGVCCIAHCYDEIPKEDLFLLLSSKNDECQDIVMMIGPEGDFSIKEVAFAMDNGFHSVSLGDCRLRTETAALYAVAIAQLTRRCNTAP